MTKKSVLMNIKSIGQKISLAVLMTASQVQAQIPSTDDFAAGADDKGAFELLSWILVKGVQVIIVGIACFFVFAIARSAIEKYGDITDGKGTWLDLAGHVVGGIVLLVLAIVMFNWVQTWSGA